MCAGRQPFAFGFNKPARAIRETTGDSGGSRRWAFCLPLNQSAWVFIKPAFGAEAGYRRFVSLYTGLHGRFMLEPGDGLFICL